MVGSLGEVTCLKLIFGKTEILVPTYPHPKLALFSPPFPSTFTDHSAGRCGGREGSQGLACMWLKAWILISPGLRRGHFPLRRALRKAVVLFV